MDVLKTSGGIQHLVQMLCAGDAIDKANAAHALGRLCCSDKHRESVARMVKASGGVQHLKQLESGGCEISKRSAQYALEQINR